MFWMVALLFGTKPTPVWTDAPKVAVPVGTEPVFQLAGLVQSPEPAWDPHVEFPPAADAPDRFFVDAGLFFATAALFLAAAGLFFAAAGLFFAAAGGFFRAAERFFGAGRGFFAGGRFFIHATSGDSVERLTGVPPERGSGTRVRTGGRIYRQRPAFAPGAEDLRSQRLV
jgi:hypothetical protein